MEEDREERKITEEKRVQWQEEIVVKVMRIEKKETAEHKGKEMEKGKMQLWKARAGGESAGLFSRVSGKSQSIECARPINTKTEVPC